MSTPNEPNDPYAGQYPLPKSAVTTSKASNEPFYMVDPYGSTPTSHHGSFHTYNDSRSSQAYSDPRSSQIYNNNSRRWSDPRSSQRLSGSRSSQTYNNNSRSSSLPSSASDYSRQSEVTMMNSNHSSMNNMKSNYHDPEAVSLREYLEAERKEKLRRQSELEMELKYSQPTKLDPVHYKATGDSPKRKIRNAHLDDEKFQYKKTYSTRSIIGLIILIFFLLIGVGLIVADKIITSRCDCEGCIECSTAFHQGILYSGIGVLCLSGAILAFKVLRRICCYNI